MKAQINSEAFAQRMGAYSHGYQVKLPGGTFIYTTGQIALDAQGQPVAVGDPGGQARFVFESLSTILAAGGASLEDVIKATIYVTNIKDFPQISAVRNEFFHISQPVSTLIEVQALVHPDCCVEIEVVAFTGERGC